MLLKDKKILIYGYGNPGRQDDGLGPALIEKLEQWFIKKPQPNISLDSNYQLNIEDAADMVNYDVVIFADASMEPALKDIKWEKVIASSAVNYTVHAMSATYLLYMCNSMYNKNPETYLLHIRGYEWKLQEGLTENAQKNLETAFNFLLDKILL